MNILLLAPIHDYMAYFVQKGNEPFVIGQGQQSWYNALIELGHNVEVYRYTDTVIFPQKIYEITRNIVQKNFLILYHRLKRLSDYLYFVLPHNHIKNVRLIHKAGKTKPNVIIISGGTSSIFPSTIELIKKKYKCPVIFLSGVNPLMSSTLSEKLMIKDKIVDIVATNDRAYKKNWEHMGCKKVIVLPISAADKSLHKKMNAISRDLHLYECDVCFIGTLTSGRQDILSQLTGFDIKIWGKILSGQSLSPTLHTLHQGQAHDKKMVKIYNAAKIVLNFQPNDMTHGGNMRTFEIPACGAFQLADTIDPDFFTQGKEYVKFDNVRDLKKKIHYFLLHDKERKTIAQNGYRRTLKEHTYSHRFKKLLSMVSYD